MTTEQLRGIKTSLVLATLLVAACSHTLPAKPLPPTVTLPAVQIPSSNPQAANEDSAAPASVPEPVAGITPAATLSQSGLRNSHVARPVVHIASQSLAVGSLLIRNHHQGNELRTHTAWLQSCLCI